jgi:predicted ferric reductase
MNLKHNGNKLILLILILTTLLFFWAKKDAIQSPVNPFLFFSQLFAVLGAILFSLSFIISSRTRFIENLFDGLPDAYKTHHLIGALGFTLLLNHPLFLILKAFFNGVPVTIYLLPVGPLPYAWGVFSLYFMIALIVLTLFINLPYNVWKFTHTFMGLSLFFAARHIFNITSDISRNEILGTWVKFFVLIGIAAFLYKLFLYRKFSGSYIYKLVKLETFGAVHNLIASPEGKSIQFKPGQFVFVRVLNNKKVSNEEHPFSLVEKNANGEIVFSIKKSGDFTNKLENLNSGDRLEIIGPFGLIHKKLHKDLDYVFIAGGIGITPFIGAVEEVLNLGRKAYFFYSIKNQSEALYDDKLKSFVGKFDKMHYKIWFSDTQGKLSITGVQSSIETGICDMADKFFLICGPKAMMYSLEKQLIEKGVDSKNIYMEDFDL